MASLTLYTSPILRVLVHLAERTCQPQGTADLRRRRGPGLVPERRGHRIRGLLRGESPHVTML